MIDWLLSLLSALLRAVRLLVCCPRRSAAAPARDSQWLIGRPLEDSEKYWAFTPLQRLFCLTATVPAQQRSRLTTQQLARAFALVIAEPGCATLACHIADHQSEAAARWCGPEDAQALHRLIQGGISFNQDGQLAAVIERELATDFTLADTAHGLWRLVLVPATDSFVLTFHHALCDGMGGRRVLQLLLQMLMQDDAGVSDTELTPHPVPGAMESLLPSAVTVAACISTAQRLLSPPPAVYIGRITEQLPLSSLSTRVHLVQLTSAQTQAARSKARSCGLSLHGLMIAASAHALNSVFGPAAALCSYQTPIDLRPWLPPSHRADAIAGNFFTSYTVTKAAGQQDPLRFAQQYMAELKSGVMDRYHAQRVLSWLAARLGMAKTVTADIAKLRNLRTGTVELSNLGAIEGDLSCTELSFTSRVHNNSPLLLLGAVTVNARLSLSLSYCTPLVNEHEAAHYVKAMLQYMHD